MMSKLWAWILPIKPMGWIEDIDMFFMLWLWDMHKDEFREKMRRIEPAYKRYREIMGKMRAEPWYEGAIV